LYYHGWYRLQPRPDGSGWEIQSASLHCPELTAAATHGAWRPMKRRFSPTRYRVGISIPRLATMKLRPLFTRIAACTVLIAAAVGAQAAPSISGRDLSVGATDVQQYLDGSFPRTQDALGGLIEMTMSHPKLTLPQGNRLDLGFDVALATAGGAPAPLGKVKLSSGLRYDAQTQGFHLDQPTVDDFTPVNNGGKLDARARPRPAQYLPGGLRIRREPIYKIDPTVAAVLGALQVQSAQVQNGKLVVTFNQDLGSSTVGALPDHVPCGGSFEK
jgi:hypothetical protein